MTLVDRVRRRVWTAMTPPEVRQFLEATAASREYQLSEPGWTSLAAPQSLIGLDAWERMDAYQAAYQYWHRDPLAGRGVQITRDYVFGRGIHFKAKDPAVQQVLDRYWRHPRNRVSISRAQAQWELQERLMLAGELFFMHFVNRFDGSVITRVIEPYEIPEGGIIADPDDWKWPLFYKRTWTRQTYRGVTGSITNVETVYDIIPDWNNLLRDQGGRLQMPRGSTVGTDNHLVVMHQLLINSHGQRGVSVLKRVLPWVKASKGFMEDRATITAALATFLFKHKIKGDAAAVARIIQQWGSYDAVNRYGAGTGKERREGGQTFVENEQSDLQQMGANSNASNAYQDQRMFRQMVGTGLGLTEPNLTGDPSISNLASITEMTGPEYRMYESYQQLWSDEFGDLFDFLIRMAQAHGALGRDIDPDVEIDFPPLVIRDLPTVISAVAQLISAQAVAQKNYVPDRRLAQYILSAFGEEDLDAALKELEQLGQQIVTARQAGTLTPEASATVESVLAYIHEATAGWGTVRDRR